jgi:hypothetical protein
VHAPGSGAYVWSDTQRISLHPERRIEVRRYGVLLGNRERWDYDSVTALISNLDAIESGQCGECG